jgi:hypothetical protein
MRNWLPVLSSSGIRPIMHDLHESQPLPYTFSGQAPQNPTLDPSSSRDAAILAV